MNEEVNTTGSADEVISSTQYPQVYLNVKYLGWITQILHELSRFDAAADGVLRRFFREHSKLGQRERGILAQVAYRVLRERRLLQHLASSGTGDTNRRMALLGLWREFGFDNMASLLHANEVQWFQHVLTIDITNLAPAVQANLPDWLYDDLVKQYGASEVNALAAAWQTQAPLDLRVNILKTTRDAAINALKNANVRAQAIDWLPLGLRIIGRPALQTTKIFKEGGVEVQDAGSQLLAYLVAPKRGEMVADFCAGAGGKTLALGALMRSTGRLYAFDISAKRLANLKPRLARSGLSNVQPILIEHENDTRVKRLKAKFDRVLVDAPCSGLGTLRRNPELKWRHQSASIKELQTKQISILSSAARLVKAGGRLVYATCSVLHEENQAVIEAFLAQHPEFVLMLPKPILTNQDIQVQLLDEQAQYLQLLPHLHGVDGFFAAVLEKHNNTIPS